MASSHPHTTPEDGDWIQEDLNALELLLESKQEVESSSLKDTRLAK